MRLVDYGSPSTHHLVMPELTPGVVKPLERQMGWDISHMVSSKTEFLYLLGKGLAQIYRKECTSSSGTIGCSDT